MRKQLLPFLRCPATGAPLDLVPFEFAPAGPEDDVRHGVLRSREGGRLYPILHGVPSLLPDSFPPEFLKRFSGQIAESLGTIAHTATRQADARWSFSGEWDTFFDGELDRTWGWTVGERVEMLLQEAQLDRDRLKGAVVLDAGCGNGMLSEALTSLGATVVGIDYSTSVFRAEARRRSPGVHFVRGDLLNPPLAPQAFDLIVSNGVLHHTRNTREAFDRVADLVKPGGRFYLWLYRHSRNPKVRFMRMREALIRPLCSRVPGWPREVLVRLDAAFLWVLTNVIERKQKCSYRELLISSYDTLTPRYAWKHHTPLEVAYWFFEKGFSAPTLTHWDNPFGYGVVARKHPLADTPGVNFGNRNAPRRRYA